MLYVVCYDISDDRARETMARRLQDFGVRIQESVFECALDEPLFDRLLGVISKVRLAAEDRVRVYRLCATGTDQVRIWGPGEVTRDPAFYLV